MKIKYIEIIIMVILIIILSIGIYNEIQRIIDNKNKCIQYIQYQNNIIQQQQLEIEQYQNNNSDFTIIVQKKER